MPGRDPSVPPRTPEEHAEFLEASAQFLEEVRDRIAPARAVRGVALASGLSGMNQLGGPVEFVADGPGPPLTGSGPGSHAVIRALLDLAPATRLFVRMKPEAGAPASRLYGIAPAIEPAAAVKAE